MKWMFGRSDTNQGGLRISSLGVLSAFENLMPSFTVYFLGNEVRLSGKGKASEICGIGREFMGNGVLTRSFTPFFPQYNRLFNLVSSCDLSLLPPCLTHLRNLFNL